MEVMQLDAIGNGQGFEILFRDSREASLHRERGGLTTTRGCLFGFVRKKTAHAREINGKAVETTPPLMEPQETKEGQPPRFREDAKFD